MRITYDPDANVAYIYLTDHTAEVETHVINDSVNIDLAPDGSLVGIELLDANRQLSPDSGDLVVRNLATGEGLRLRLAA